MACVDDLAYFHFLEVPEIRDTPTACLVLISRWVRRQTGEDHLPDGVLGMTQEEAEAAMSKWGGLPLQVGRVCRQKGFPLVRDPVPGDIGVVKVGQTLSCGVRTASGWLAWVDHHPTWVASSCVRCVASWRIA